MPLSSIANRLRLKVGLALESLGGSALETAVKSRMQALAVRDVRDYSAQLSWDVTELSRLVEELVVRETWFFRENGAFRDLASRALAARKARPDKVFRVLSAPCSTGEEPYSIAITLLDLGLPRKSFKIDAVDISKTALAAAERGIYRPHSFRGVEEDFRMRYFDLRQGEFQIAAEVRECVRFLQGNLADPMFLHNEIAYQVIFCRNVLIYMHDEARKTALESLSRLLDPGGLLFAGHAEALDSMSRHFRRAGGSFAFVRRGSSTRPVPGVRSGASVRPSASSVRPSAPSVRPAPSVKPDSRPERGKRSSGATPRREAPTSIAAKARASQAAPRTLSRPPPDPLTLAAALADKNELERAAVLCEQHLAERGPNADAYSLLGVVRKAQGQLSEAENSFSRALYLQPSHAEALAHMASIYESRGDLVAAQNFRRRAERSGKREL